MDNQRNLLLAVALSGLLILGWDLGMRYFYPQASLSGQTEEVATAGEASPTASAPGSIETGAATPAAPVDLATALAAPERVRIDADRTVLVAHHVPFRGDGSLEYDPLQTIRQIRRDFGVKPLWAASPK